MSKVTVMLGFQPNEMAVHDEAFFSGLGADTLAYQTGNLQGVEYSKTFIERAAKQFLPNPYLCSMDSHDFNNWNDSNHWKKVLDNTKQIAAYMQSGAATGVILNCEQENHLIPLGKFSQRSDPKFVWPGDPAPPKPTKPKKGEVRVVSQIFTGPDRCRQWVQAIRSVWPEAEIHLWLTSAVQTNANPGFYPCMNAICEEAGGCYLWLSMWQVGYGFGSDPNLPKRKTLPDKIQKGKTWFQLGKPELWEAAALATFTQKVKNKVVPCFSFSNESVQYYQKQIKAGQVKDYLNMLDMTAVDFYKHIENTCLIIWGDAFAVDPAVYPYVQNLITTFQKG
jgi:hypothetical protein